MLSQPHDDEYEERAAIIEHDGGLPKRWAEPLARLLTAPKPGAYLPERWEIIKSDAAELVGRNWARLDTVGWSPADVKALIPMIDGRRILAIHMGDLVVEMPNGSKATICRRPVIDGPANWNEGRRTG